MSLEFEREMREELAHIKTLLRRLQPERHHRGFIIVGPEGKLDIMSFNITEGQSKTATASFTDANGTAQPLPAGNKPAWAVSPDGALALTPSDDGMSCTIVGGSTVGAVTLTATVEADPTPGVNTVTATIAGAVVAPEDTQGTITVA